MPELPEVETIKETLKQCVLNQKIVDVQVHYPKLIQNMDVQLFAKKLIGQTFNEIMRKGKYLIFHLSDGFLIVHLRMEGKFYYDYHHIDRHSHLIFTFDNQKNLVYHDVRKFGRMVYYDKNVDIYQVLPLSQLGKEPFELKDGTYFYQKIKKSQKTLKQILLDQTILAGIGNIYADEICFASRLSPLKKGNTLTLKDCNELIKQAKIVLSKAIQLGGSTIKSYHSAQGIDGLFQNELMVYGKKGKPCPICHQPIVKIKVSGRGTHYCPNCQKED